MQRRARLRRVRCVIRRRCHSPTSPATPPETSSRAATCYTNPPSSSSLEASAAEPSHSDPGAPGSIKADAAGNLLVNDQTAATITEYTEAGIATGHSIKTTAGASCISFGISQTGMVGCPVYVPYQSSGTIATTYAFPRKAIKQTFTSTLMSQPYSFAFAN